MAESPEVQQILSGLERPLGLAYELTNGPDGKPVYWSLAFGDTAEFGLAPDRDADVTMRGDWKSMIQLTLGQPAESEVVPTGDLGQLPKLMELIEAIRPYGAVPVEFPDLS
jgi:hypothetical protein